MLALWIFLAFAAGGALGATIFWLAGRTEAAALRATLAESQRTG